MSGNLYAVDGRCHNANRGTYGHECGKPAVWLGRTAAGFTSGFCDRCKRHGDESRAVTHWVAIETADLAAIAAETARGMATPLLELELKRRDLSPTWRAALEQAADLANG